MANENVIDEVLDAVRDRIRGLDLPSIPDANVVSMLNGDVEDGDGPNVPGFPAVIVSMAGSESIVGGTNASDDTTYPIGVVLVSKENRNQTTNRKRNLFWRVKIQDAFSEKRLSLTLGAAWRCEVRPASVVDRPAWAANLHAQGILIVVYVRRRVRG